MIPIKYNLRNLAVRKTTTLAAGGGLALVVFVFAAVLMLFAGIDRTLGRSASPDVAVVLRKGADNELSSSIPEEQLKLIVSSPGVAKDAQGKDAASGELMVIVLLDKI